MNANLRKALEADLPWMIRLAGECPSSPQWSEAVWQGVFAECRSARPFRAILIAEGEADEPAGFVVAACIAGVAEMENLAVSAACRRQGLGSALCMRAMAWARAQGADRMELEVRESNRGAIALYESAGFMVQGRRAGYYEHPVEDAFLMTSTLSGENMPAAQV
jgi:ribosomal-protein-alanine N-acetyltransferase